MTTTLPPRTGMGPAELGRYLRDRLERDVTDVTDAYGTPIVTVAPAALPRAARLCKSDPNLAFDFFDWLSAVDLREEGLAVVVHLYSTRHRHHVQLRTVAPGGRTDPRVPSLTGSTAAPTGTSRDLRHVRRHLRRAPGLLPRLLTVENFEGWPLRKEFLLTTREAKPWPGAKEPEERHEEPAGQAAAPGAATTAAPAPAGRPRPPRRPHRPPRGSARRSTTTGPCTTS